MPDWVQVVERSDETWRRLLLRSLQDTPLRERSWHRLKRAEQEAARALGWSAGSWNDRNELGAMFEIQWPADSYDVLEPEEEVRKRIFCDAILYYKCIILPRQARDKHREKLKEWKCVFLQEVIGSWEHLERLAEAEESEATSPPAAAAAAAGAGSGRVRAWMVICGGSAMAARTLLEHALALGYTDAVFDERCAYRCAIFSNSRRRNFQSRLRLFLPIFRLPV